MEESHTPPTVIAPGLPPSPSPPPPTEYAPTPSIAQPSAFELAQRVSLLLLLRGRRLIGRGWLAVAPQFGWIALTGILLLVIAVLGLTVALPQVVASPGNDRSDLRVAAIPPAPAVLAFLRGQATFDADLMWEALSPELRTKLEAQAMNHETMAEQIERERRAGQRYHDYQYIGGLQIDNSRSMYFYVVEVSSSEASDMVSYVFTVDRNGKIINIE